MASVQLSRLASIKTAARRTSSGSQSAESTTAANSVGSQRRLSQDRASTSSSHQGGGEDATVRIEVFAHGAIGKEAVLVASLSNSVLLVMRIGGGGEGLGGGRSGVRSWLLDWPVSGKIRGLCVSPDLQCVLCVTENLEGVYILAVDNLGAQDASQPTVPAPNLDRDPHGSKPTSAAGKGSASSSGGVDGARERGVGGKRSSAAAVAGAGATTVRPPPRSVAATAFPSLLHLASRGQRKRSGGAVAYPSAEPVFIASLARRAGDGERKGEQGDGGRSDRRQSSGSDGRGSSTGAGRRASRSARANAQFECLWWAARNGDHFAIIGGPGGEVHFLDLERLDAWVVKPPPPVMARGRVCALTITADLTSTRSSSQVTAGGGKGDSTSSPSIAAERSPAEKEYSEPPRHLVVILEKGAVFVVLLESRRPGSGGGDGTGNNYTGIEGDPDIVIKGEVESRGGITAVATECMLGAGDSDKGGRSRQHSEYVRAGADRADQAEFAPSWLDVGRGGGGGSGGGMGVRALPPVGPSGSGPAISSSGGGSGGGGDACRRMRMSIISRAWGSKCSIKILRVAAMPDAKGGGDKQRKQGKGREWGGGGGKQHALRTETVRQVSLPVDHASPEQHALAAVDGTWAVLASSPAGAAPARITVAPLGAPESPATHPIRVFTLPHGEHIGGVVLLSGSNAGMADQASTPSPAGEATEEDGGAGPWGLVWSECSIYRIDLGGTQQARPKTEGAGRTDGPQTPTSLSPRPQPHLLPSPPRHSLAGVAAAAGATASIALRRPSAASVRRAREMHASGRLGEAAQLAIEALGGHTSSVVGSRVARSRSLGEEETAGGGATTRMVREDLANSLLEWLVTLQGRQPRASPHGAVSDMPEGAGDAGTIGGGNIQAPESNLSAKRGSTRPPSASQGSGAPREPKATACPRGSSKNELRRDLAASKARAPFPAVSQTAPPLLERYLLASRDYDPVLAATLLHAHGEADLAVLAGTARGDMALAGILRVLAESTWPPRLSTRAVEALCSDETGAAPREAVLAGGGTLFAALEPSLQLRVLLSEKSIMFGGCDGGGPAAASTAAAAAARGESTALPVGRMPVGGSKGDLTRPTVSRAIAGVTSHLGPILPALSVEDLSGLISRLAQWCKEDAASLVEKSEEEPKGSPPKTADTAHHGRGGDSEPSAASVEAVEMILRALCELSGRQPPSGDHHRRVWLCAGCLGSVGESERPLLRPAPQTRVGDIGVAFSCAPEGGTGNANSGETLLAGVGGWGASGAPVLKWAQLTTQLCDVLRGEGASSGWVCEVGGGLPTVARLRLLRVLPVVWGWHEPVRLMMRLRGAGCWAAVALELELSMNRREAASAMLHGVVHLLQDGEGVTPGEAARILNGKGSIRHRTPPPPSSQSETLPTGDTIHDRGQSTATAAEDIKCAASTVLLRVIDTHVFRRDSNGAGDCHSTSTAAPSTADGGGVPRTGSLLPVAATSPAALHEIRARASILAEALCVWGQAGLPRTPLEAALRPRLDDRDDARVLAAVFFPQLSCDRTRATAPGGNQEETAVAAEGVRTGYARWGKAIAAGVSAGPTASQIEAARKLGLSPRFTLALLRVAEKPHSLPCSTTPLRNADSLGDTSRGDHNQPEPALSSATTSHPTSSSGMSLPSVFFPARNTHVGASTPAPSALALLLEDRAGGGRERGRVGVAMSGSGGASTGAESSVLHPPGARGQPATWPGAVAGGHASGAAAVTAAAAAAAADENADGVWFSCGHRFSRDHLLRTVVPTCLSAVSQATSSLQRTRQILTLEYEGQSAGAACPECAANELGRLVAGLRPAAASSRVVGGRGTKGGSAPPPPPLSPSPRPQRLPKQERTTVW